MIPAGVCDNDILRCVLSRYCSLGRIAEKAICSCSEKILPCEGQLTSRHDVSVGGMGDKRRAG